MVLRMVRIEDGEDGEDGAHGEDDDDDDDGEDDEDDEHGDEDDEDDDDGGDDDDDDDDGDHPRTTTAARPRGASALSVASASTRRFLGGGALVAPVRSSERCLRELSNRQTGRIQLM